MEAARGFISKPRNWWGQRCAFQFKFEVFAKLRGHVENLAFQNFQMLRVET